MRLDRRNFIGGVLAATAATTASGAAGEKRRRDVVVYVSGHPDDLAGSMGTVIRLAEKYDVHMIDYTHGELGCGKQGQLDGSTRVKRTAEEEAVCREVGITLHWCEEMDCHAYAGQETCARIAKIFEEIKPRALIVHSFMDINLDHMMSAAAAIKAAEMANIRPEIYFQEQTRQSRGFQPVYYVDVSKLVERKQKLCELYACQNGAKIGERKNYAAHANAMRISGGWEPITHCEVFGVFPGTVLAGKGIFDEMEGVLR